MVNQKRLDHRILQILIPAIMENALLTLSDMILTGYIGRLSVSQISAYGISSRIYGIYFAVFKGFAIGAMVIFARAFGAGDRRKAASLYKQATGIAVPVALAVAIIIWLIPETLLFSMSDDPSLLTVGASYLKINVLTYPLLALIHLNSAAFQADGNTKTPLYIATIGNAVSIVLGYVLIIGIGSYGGLGLTGAAITANIRIIVMAVVGLWLLFGNGVMFAQYKDVHMEMSVQSFKELVGFGIPTAIGNSFWNIAAVFLSTYILSYGQENYAAYQLGLQAEGFCDMMAAGFMTASMSLAGKAIGAKDKEMYHQSYGRLNYYCLVISGINMVFLLLFSKPVLYLLTDKQNLVEIAHVYLLLMVFSQYPEMKSKVTYGFIRSAGYGTTPTVIDMIGIWGVRVFGCYLISMVFHLDIVWIWWIINADQWVRCLLSMAVCRVKRIIYLLEESGNEQIESCHI